MTQKELKAEHEKKLHLAVGSFVVNFEHLALRLRLYLLGMFHDREKNGYLSRLFVRDLGFEQMVQRIRQIGEYHLYGKKEHEDLFEVQKLVLDACKEINTKRNQVVHGAWMINYRTMFGEVEPDLPETAVMRKAVDLHGDFTFLVYSIDDIDKFTELVKRIMLHFENVYQPLTPTKTIVVDDDDLKEIISEIKSITGKPRVVN